MCGFPVSAVSSLPFSKPRSKSPPCRTKHPEGRRISAGRRDLVWDNRDFYCTRDPSLRLKSGSVRDDATCRRPRGFSNWASTKFCGDLGIRRVFKRDSWRPPLWRSQGWATHEVRTSRQRRRSKSRGRCRRARSPSTHCATEQLLPRSG